MHLKLLNDVAKRMGLNPGQIKNLTEPDIIHEFELKVSGKKHKAYRVQHRDKRGPYKGGIRFHQEVTSSELTTLALLMTLKTALFNLPLGGAKGGVVINPKEHTRQHLENVARDYAKQLHRHIGPDKDIPAPDVNTNQELINLMVEEYKRITGDASQASFTGKPPDRGGIKIRGEATGRGGVYVLAEYLSQAGRNMHGTTIALQGIGNVGFNFAKIAQQEYGMSIVAVANSRHTLSNQYGFDFSEISDDKQAYDALENQAERISSTSDIVAKKADVLVCAALSDAINTDNASDVKADIILELANDPVSADTVEQLEDKGVVIIPDILANGGGVVASYMEWRQNLENKTINYQDSIKELFERMTDTAQAVAKLTAQENVTLRQSSLMLALKNLYA